MPIPKQRLLQLALDKLRAERERIDQEIAEIDADLKRANRASQTKRTQKSSQRRRRPKLSAEERGARSKRMKKYWRERKKAEKVRK